MNLRTCSRAAFLRTLARQERESGKREQGGSKLPEEAAAEAATAGSGAKSSPEGAKSSCEGANPSSEGESSMSDVWPSPLGTLDNLEGQQQPAKSSVGLMLEKTCQVVLPGDPYDCQALAARLVGRKASYQPRRSRVLRMSMKVGLLVFYGKVGLFTHLRVLGFRFSDQIRSDQIPQSTNDWQG